VLTTGLSARTSKDRPHLLVYEMSRRFGVHALLCDEMVAVNIAFLFDKRGQKGQYRSLNIESQSLVHRA